MKVARRPRPPRRPIERDILFSSDAMLRYALASGLKTPTWVIDAVRRADAFYGPGSGRDADGTPGSAVALAAEAAFDALLRARAELIKIVAPATPRTILLVSEGRRSRLSALGPVRLVRHMLVAVLLLLLAFVLLAMSPDVNLHGDEVLDASGGEVLLNELFFLTAGGLGAAFSALFTAYRYISDGTYDPKYESTYWVRFILGLMAGLLLPALIPLGGDADGGGAALSRPLLALLGGFSAAVVYRILERLVAAVESVVQADTREVRTAERELESGRAALEVERERLTLIGELRRLEDQARARGGAPELGDAIDDLIRKLLSGEPDEAATPPAVAPGARSAAGKSDVAPISD